MSQRATPSSHQSQHDGYTIADDLSDPQTLAEDRRRLDTMLATLKPGERPEHLVEPHVIAPDWTYWLHRCADPRILDAVQRCLGCDEIILLMSHLIVKPAHNGLAVAWHQDNTYWPSVDGLEIATVWLAIDDVDVGNSCMHVIPRTHVGCPALAKLPTQGDDLLHIQVAVTPEMEADAIAVQLRAGSASLHDSFIIHGSKPNLSNRRRAGFTMRYGNAASVRVDVAKHNKPVYYLRGDSTNLKPDYRDFRPGCPYPTTSGIEHRHQKSLVHQQ